MLVVIALLIYAFRVFRDVTTAGRVPVTWRGAAVRVGVLGAGVVGSQVVRLLTEQADELAARVGAKLELVAVAVRRPARHPEIARRTADHRRGRRWSPGTTSTSSSR